MYSLQVWPKQYDIAQVKLRVVYVGYMFGDSVKGCVGACPQKDFTEVLLQRFKALFQVPSSVSLLFICYVPYTMSRKTWYVYTVALSIRLLLYLHHHKYVYMTNSGLPTLGVVVLQDDLYCVQSPCLPVLV